MPILLPRPIMPAMPPPPIASDTIWRVFGPPRPPPAPRPTPCDGAPGFSLCGLRTVSSMLRMTQAASVAAANELSLLAAGSQTPARKVSQVPPPSHSTSTPIQRPASDAAECSLRSLFNTSVLSMPALSASCRGMISRALAKELMISCCFPSIVRECFLSTEDSSISMAPPPATTFLLANARLTIMRASCTDRSVSSRNCSPPPLRMMVAVLALGQPLKKLNRSSPRPRSSNTSQWPSTAPFRPCTEVCTKAPVALATRSRSSVATLPALKMPLSAKYCVARSPIGRRDRMILAPLSTHMSSLS
mmetsp:Transcript_22774/g.31221  ORF Transcript_22774/g.31221 Transcript_22774/m.31221 type:complete len:304 (-) Transcript_22774:843-1754(-)